MYSLFTWSQLHKAANLAKHNNLLSLKSLIKTGLPKTNSICCILLDTGIQLLFARPENHREFWLVILFLSGKKFHANQIFVF